MSFVDRSTVEEGLMPSCPAGVASLLGYGVIQASGVDESLV